MITIPDNMLHRALAYARQGWPVFPCRPGSKEPATRHGFHDATTHDDQIRNWWNRQPTANIAIATGQPGPDVLDIDQHGRAGNGFAAYRRLSVAGLLDGIGAVVATPGGGLHLYFAGSRQPSGRLPRHHLDFRASGGYVLAPPSQVDGNVYRLIWHHARASDLEWPAVVRLLEPPEDRLGRLHRAGALDGGRLAAWVARLESGNRNCGLFWAACRAIEAGRLDTLDELAAAAARTGLPDREITRTIASARRSAQRDVSWSSLAILMVTSIGYGVTAVITDHPSCLRQDLGRAITPNDFRFTKGRVLLQSTQRTQFSASRCSSAGILSTA